jgi:hypothetical protein
MRYLVTLLIGFLLGVAVVATIGAGFSPVVARAQDGPATWEYKYVSDGSVESFVYQLNQNRSFETVAIWPGTTSGSPWTAIMRRPAQ